MQPFGQHGVQVELQGAVSQQMQRALVQWHGVVHEAVEVVGRKYHRIRP